MQLKPLLFEGIFMVTAHVCLASCSWINTRQHIAKFGS